jgi:hypothetical protein
LGSGKSVEVNLESEGGFQYLSYTRPLPPIPLFPPVLSDPSLENSSNQKRMP